MLSENGEILSFFCYFFKGLFQFHAQHLGTLESFWKFYIPEHDLYVPFLVVCTANEPSITFDRSHVQFKPILLYHQTDETVYLVNSEPNTALTFEFDEASRHLAGNNNSLLVSPMTGVIQPNSRQAISLDFTAQCQDQLNFSLLCR